MRDYPSVKLSRLKKQALPEHFVFLDVETKHSIHEGIQRHKLRLGWACFFRLRHGQRNPTIKWQEFKSGFSLCKALDACVKDKTTVYVFIHNAFFDLQASEFFHYFSKWGWRLDFHHEKGSTYILTISNGKRHLKIISTTNYFPVSLKKLGSLIGLEKLEIDFATKDEIKLSEYCKRDVEILMKTVLLYIDFIKKHNMGSFSITRASQAFTGYRYRFMKKAIWVHRIPYVVDLERGAYYGGRVECFEFGKIKGNSFTTLDINSQYPFIMQNYKLPVKLLDYQVNPDSYMVQASLENYMACAEVLLNTEEPVYAKRMNKKIIFPIGKFSTFLCTGGLKYAFEHNHIRHIKQISYYRGEYIFKDYVKELYNLRLDYKEKDNFIMEQFCKYLLNSLYGKFGQKIPITETEYQEGTEYYREETFDAVTRKFHIVYKMFNTLVTEKGEFREGKFSVVSIPAHITEYARLLLWDYMQIVGTDNLLYVDTDSLKMRSAEVSRLERHIDQNVIGLLKTEKVNNKLWIFGAKNYTTENERKIKGVPLKAELIAPYTYRYTHFCKQKMHLRKRVDRYYMVKDVIKVAKPKYDKGIILPSSKIVPFRLEEF